MSDREAFERLLEECPLDPAEFTCEWVKWMRDTGYDARMHGGLLHAFIVNHLIDIEPIQSQRIAALHEAAQQTHE